MNLYIKSNNNLEFYKLTPKSEKVKEYKENKMKKIPEDERVLKATCNEDYISECTLHYNDTVLASRLNYTQYSLLDFIGYLFEKILS